MDPQSFLEENREERVEDLVKEQEIHRTGDQEGPFSIHVLGLGQTGASVIEQLLQSPPRGFLEDPRTRFTALAVDIGNENLEPVNEAATAAGLPEDRAQVRTVDLGVPSREDLFSSLRRYREYLKVEYPRYYWNPNYEPWLPEDVELPEPGNHIPRALAKAIYNTQYYEGGEIARELDDFAQSINASETVPIVFVVFSLAGGTGSGIVFDMARHLATVKLGRRHIVVGIGVSPSEGDPTETREGVLFPVLNELDCMLDGEKNEGVQAVWGDLYKNPFSGGFFMAPQDGIFELTGDISATHRYVDEGIVSFLTQEHGLHIYETLKLLNWLNAPAQMHPATRAPIGDRWVNVLLSQKPDDAESLHTSLGHVTDGVETEYVEARVLAPSGAFDPEAGGKKIKDQITSAISALVEPEVIHFDTEDDSFVHVSVPRLTKLDLPEFLAARDAYDRLSWDEKLLAHSWLLDLGTMLCEPSTRFEGMAGECIWGCACWVVVPYEALRGEQAGQRASY